MEEKNEFEGMSKKEIDEQVPIIKPENCPGELIKYFNSKHKADNMAMRESIREEMSGLKRWMQMTATNRVWLIILSFLFFGLAITVIYHLV